jgi:hypothetical protein
MVCHQEVFTLEESRVLSLPAWCTKSAQLASEIEMGDNTHEDNFKFPNILYIEGKESIQSHAPQVSGIFPWVVKYPWGRIVSRGVLQHLVSIQTAPAGIERAPDFWVVFQIAEFSPS